MLDHLQGFHPRRLPNGVAVTGLMLLLVAQVLLGTAVHHHVLGEHDGAPQGAVHGDFAHVWHADQHNLVPDGLIPDTLGDTPPLPLAGAFFIAAAPLVSRWIRQPRERCTGPSPPRYCLPQP
ncbi:hypothetical protein, partial [Halomonas sp. 22501_18_FS]|uniref:hypothetical protein n=1 Tax=Halomonas sp. 22501_18_FS TaxID=2665505 RepID=UPI002572E77B